MAYLTDLADVIRTSGLRVIEVDGWRTRGHGGMGTPRGVVCHHTAGPRDGDYPSLAVVRDGRPDLEGPLSALGLGRSGDVYVIAAGLSWHAGDGAWPGLHGNWDCIGIEAESTGYGDWTDAQLDAYPRLAAALCKGYGIPPELVIAHREWAPTRKVDPTGINMDTLRADCAQLLDDHQDHQPPPEGEDMSAAEVEQILGALRGAAAGDVIPLGTVAPGEAKTFYVAPRNPYLHTGAQFIATVWGDNEESTDTVKLAGKQFFGVNPAAATGLWDGGTTWELLVPPRGGSTGHSAEVKAGCSAIHVANLYAPADDADAARHTVQVVLTATPPF